MQTKTITISMKVTSLLVNQGNELSDEEILLSLGEFLSTQIYFPPYQFTGEINNKAFEIQLVFDKKSPILNDLFISNEQ